MSKIKINVPDRIRRYFNEHLPIDRGVSPETVSSYSETMYLFMNYLKQFMHVRPERIAIGDISTKNVLGFLQHIQKRRGNADSSRNVRLAAIQSFVKYVLIDYPLMAGDLQGVLSISYKQTTKKIPEFLSHEEMDAVIAAPDTSKWAGKRDKTMFLTMYNIGARVSETTALKVKDVSFGKQTTVYVFGKGRKERCVPVRPETAVMLKNWIESNRLGMNEPLFPNNRGQAMSRSAVEKRLASAVETAQKKVPSLGMKKISPHTIRHTTATHLHEGGMDIIMIAAWLGHESIATTHIYTKTSIKMKEKALAILQGTAEMVRYKAEDTMLIFLKKLKK